jgi:hypothetical protein
MACPRQEEAQPKGLGLETLGYVAAAFNNRFKLLRLDRLSSGPAYEVVLRQAQDRSLEPAFQVNPASE